MPVPQPFPLMTLPVGNVVFTVQQGIQNSFAKEDVSIAFVAAIVAQAGYETSPFKKRDDGIDFNIFGGKMTVKGVTRRDCQMGVQMKATSHPDIDGNSIIYRFKTREQYLRLKELGTQPQSLIVYVMPDDRQKWTVSDDNHLDLVGHAFFLDMANAPNLGPNDSPKVTIPMANRLTTLGLIDFFRTSINQFWG